MNYPTVDLIIQTLVALCPAAKIFKVDISQAFRQIRINLLGLQHNNQIYLDLSVLLSNSISVTYHLYLAFIYRFILSVFVEFASGLGFGH